MQYFDGTFAVAVFVITSFLSENFLVRVVLALRHDSRVREQYPFRDMQILNDVNQALSQ